MKDRVLPCIHYKYNGVCDLDKECHFWKEMQKCQRYTPNKAYRPIRTDRRKQKKEKILKKEIRKGEW